MACRLFDSKYSDWSAKISSKLPKFNISPDTGQLYANAMIIVAFLGVIPLAIQCWRVYRTKEAKGISVYAFMFSILLSVLWIIYALLTRNGVIIISSTLSIIAALTLVLLSRKYQRQAELGLGIVDSSL